MQDTLSNLTSLLEKAHMENVCHSPAVQKGDPVSAEIFMSVDVALFTLYHADTFFWHFS